MIQFDVSDMTCGHCESTIRRVVKEVDAASRCDVDLGGKRVRWIDTQKKGSAAAADLAQWVEERSKIAAQTASLTREGTAAGWRWSLPRSRLSTGSPSRAA